MSLAELISILQSHVTDLILVFGVVNVIHMLIEREYFKLYSKKKKPERPEFFKIYLSRFGWPGYVYGRYYWKLVFESHKETELNILARLNLALLFILFGTIFSLLFLSLINS